MKPTASLLAAIGVLKSSADVEAGLGADAEPGVDAEPGLLRSILEEPFSLGGDRASAKGLANFTVLAGLEAGGRDAGGLDPTGECDGAGVSQSTSGDSELAEPGLDWALPAALGLAKMPSRIALALLPEPAD
mmetsp:Transcript_56032/g.99767  ORF Transcript_56032/g.99767 Transcript_56032/m.99767 type:complete len:132 (-) Transcript_56032:113-508(-)